tara:strand:- start:838 stop:1326 length:489 start_codon:yes stop_codon:yes gene_type:complete
MANQTFGVTTTEVQAYCPQISFGSSDAITSARLTVLINHGASRLNGVMIAAGLSPDTIAGDATSTAYLNAQQIIIGLMLPHIYKALTLNSDPAAEEMSAWSEAMISAILTTPEILGASDATLASTAKTTVDLLDLDTGQAAMNARRIFWSHTSEDGPKTFNW